MAMRATRRTYMTPDAIKTPPAKRCGRCCSRAALCERTIVVTVDDYAPPKIAANTTPPRCFVTFCKT
jgi:hypothetical protein